MAFINPLIAGSWRSLFREFEMSVKWTARTPPKRQVEGSNPSEPVPILSLYLCPHVPRMEANLEMLVRNKESVEVRSLRIATFSV